MSDKELEYLDAILDAIKMLNTIEPRTKQIEEIKLRLRKPMISEWLYNEQMQQLEYNYTEQSEHVR